MFEINERVIRNYSNETFYRRGLDYYEKGKVEDFNIEISHDKRMDTIITKIYAEVSSSNECNYEVRVDFNDKTGFMHFYCDCESFSTYYPGRGVCKHIVAVLHKYHMEKDVREKSQRNNKLTNLVTALKDSFTTVEEDKNQVRLEAKYKFVNKEDKKSSIELKIYEKKKYVIKNIKDFLKVVRFGNESIEFGKNFIFDPRKDTFLNEDKKLINLLMEILEMDNMAADEDYFFDSKSKFMSGKKVYLTDMNVKRFFNIMGDNKFETMIGEDIYPETRVLYEDMPLKFEVKVDNKDIHIKQVSEMPIPITFDNEFYFLNGSIYKPSEEQERIYRPLFEEMSENTYKTISIDESQAGIAIPYLIGSLKKISKDVVMDTGFKELFYDADVSPRIYLDKVKEGVTAKIIFDYGDIQFNPLNEITENKGEKIFVRDIARELKLLKILNDFGYEKCNDAFMISNEEKIVDFLTVGLVKLQKYGEIYYSEEFKKMKIYNPSNFRSIIRINDEDLLEFSFSIEGIDNEELKNIFKAIKEKRKYYKLKKGGFMPLDSDKIKNISKMIEYLDIKDSEFDKGSIPLSKYNIMYIDQYLDKNAMDYVERNKRFKDIVSNIKEIKNADFEIPKCLDDVMRNYQKSGFKWLKTLNIYGFGGILADEMGLGKTIQSIALVASYVAGGGKKTSIVVAPTSLVYNWRSEFEKFSPDINVLIISGNKEERDKQIEEIADHDVIITSYPLIRRDIVDYKSIDFQFCFLDEAQQIKNPGSLNAQTVKEIKANGYFALTGTPIENSLTELWSIFDFIMPGYLMSHGKFLKKYELPIIKEKDMRALEELNRHIQPFILRRLKKDVVKELPPKIEHKIIVELTEEQKKTYAAYLNMAKKQINSEISEKGFDKTRIKIFSLLTRLRQLCCDPSVFIEDYKGESGKMLALDDLLQESIEQGHRVLLFSQFTSVLKNIKIRLDKASISYLYLDGSTKSEDRGTMVTEFNEGTADVFLISLKAGGAGLNLTGADVVIHFDPWWNPSVENQATDRAHRIGQTKTVEVIKLIAKGTIEEKICIIQDKKKKIIESILNDNGESEDFVLSKLTQDELESLLE